MMMENSTIFGAFKQTRKKESFMFLEKLKHAYQCHELDHGLRTPNEAFFIEIQNFWAWADKLGR